MLLLLNYLLIQGNKFQWPCNQWLKLLNISTTLTDHSNRPKCFRYSAYCGKMLFNFGNFGTEPQNRFSQIHKIIKKNHMEYYLKYKLLTSAPIQPKPSPGVRPRNLLNNHPKWFFWLVNLETLKGPLLPFLTVANISPKHHLFIHYATGY